MPHITDFITKYSWEDILITLFVIVDDICLFLYGASSRPRARGPQPDMADSEVITMAIFTDTFFYGNEELALAHIANYHRDLFPRLLTRSRFNRRRRALVREIESVRCWITTDLGVENDPYRLIDSLAIELCEYVRRSRCLRLPPLKNLGNVTNGLASSPARGKGSSLARACISLLPSKV